ncbi:MAG TPA: lysophospholipid acyltransferase family protein [Rariglobus sp.]|jgi:lysophospholipid acyltransferase (LPLAT)-like uncharacterized protein|nr:lysophospholipid acyltransferase family protein [Rariglobus sp.]
MSSASRKIVVHALSGWRYLVLLPLAMILRAWTLSLKIEFSPLTRHQLGDIQQPVIFVLWHNRLFTAAEMFRRHGRNREVYGLVSTSRDGAWLEAFFSLAGIRSVRGSSHKRGREAALGLVEVLRAGHDVGITPDGPRGPLYQFKPGGTVIARRTGSPMVLLGSAYEGAWQVPSWDRFYLPHPFSRVRVAYDLVTSEEIASDHFSIDQLEQKLRALNPDGPVLSSKPVVV